MHPVRLRPGDTIGVIAPARWLDEDRLNKAAGALEGAGFKVKLSPQNQMRDGLFAGTDGDRARALEENFADPEVKAVMCARGGYGALRIADSIDYGLIGAHPKIFVGYSDITCLLLAIQRRTGLITYHGPMLVDLAESPLQDNFDHLIATMTGDDPAALAAPLVQTSTALRPGAAEGPLIGGNLTILANMLGTGTDFDTGGAILFIEDVDEYLYNVDRMLLHLKRSDKLDGLAALVVGSFSAIKENDEPFGRTIEEMVLDHCASMDFPIVTEFPTGHGAANMTLPVGAQASVEAASDGSVSFKIAEAGVA